ncbi:MULTISPECIES: host cell division inhibitor Icd-like protein [Rahnella]|uniref:host cell division inhibitor Icd-like protein n=1 Tax=Rahnella TaxID=34037 RepID=UPI003F6DE4DE
MISTTTAPTLSGQLSVSFSPAQALHNSLGVSQCRPGRLTYRQRFDYRETRELANLMILFNSGESPESANPLIYPRPSLCTSEHDYCSCSLKPENYSGSAEHKHYLGSLVIHCGCTHENQQPTGKEKGSTANAALCDDCSSIHEENQSPKNFGDSQPSFRGAVHYESSVVHISTYTKSVGQSSCDSLAFLRCLRLISLRAEATKKPAILSPSSFTSSMDSKSSKGNLTDTCSDLLFFLPVAITDSHVVRWCSVCTKLFLLETLTWCSPENILVVFTLLHAWCKNDNAPEWWNTTEASIQTVSKDNDMACLHDTQTRPEKKYLWRFLALNRSDIGAKPCRISVEAPTEHDARRVLAPFFILSLSARLSAQGVCNV